MNLDNIVKSMQRVKNSKNAQTKYGFTDFIIYVSSLLKKAKAGDITADNKLQNYWGLNYVNGEYLLPGTISYRDIWVLKVLNDNELMTAYQSEAYGVKNTALIRFEKWEISLNEKNSQRETN